MCVCMYVCMYVLFIEKTILYIKHNILYIYIYIYIYIHNYYLQPEFRKCWDVFNVISVPLAGNVYQARMGPNSNTKMPETYNLDAQMSLNCFEKKRRYYTMVNMPPSQLFGRPVAGIKFEMSSICAYNFTISV